MNRVLAMLLVVSLASPAVAGRRCGRTYQSITSSHGWGQACYTCHKSKAKAFSWREAIIELEKTKADYAAFSDALGKVTGPTQTLGYGANAYGQTIQGEYSSYPVQGNTIYGVQSYSTHPLINLNAAYSNQAKLAQALTAGAQATATDHADLTSLAYTLENDRQAKFAAFSAVQAIAQGHPPQPQASTFRFQATVGPTGQIQIQPDQPQPGGEVQPLGVNLGRAVLQDKCAACHTPEGAHGVQGKFDLTNLSQEMLEAAADRVNRPDDDPQRMPRVKTEDGFGPAPVLNWQDKHAIEDLALNGVQ